MPYAAYNLGKRLPSRESELLLVERYEHGKLTCLGGVYRPGVPQVLDTRAVPIYQGESLEDLREQVATYLTNHPEDTLHLFDSENVLVDICESRIHTQQYKLIEEPLAYIASIALFGVICLIAAPLGLSPWGWTTFLGISLFYTLAVSSGMENEVEGCVASLIVLVLIILTLASLRKASHDASLLLGLALELLS